MKQNSLFSLMTHIDTMLMVLFQTMWLDVNAKSIQVDVAGRINSNGCAPVQSWGGVNTVNGAGGGHGAGGGQGKNQHIVGQPHGSLYEPSEFGTKGGNGRNAPTHVGGAGGGIVKLVGTSKVEIDGDVICDGDDAHGYRAGGGAGGSIYISTQVFQGQGRLLVRGGSVPKGQHNENSVGGGGGGGRISIWFQQSLFIGSALAHGGNSNFECGGAGTILWRNTTDKYNRLVVNNYDKCTPLISHIDFNNLDNEHQGRDSFHTWLFDRGDDHNHKFDEVELSGHAHLALYRQNSDVFNQTLYIGKTVGDKTGILHVGPQQVRIHIM